MLPIFNKLFYVWLVLLPFGYQISGYTGVIEPDKAIALLLLVIGLIALFCFSEYRRNHIAVFMLLAIVLLVSKNISLFDSELYWMFLWNDANKITYFFIPLLFINNIDTFRYVGWIVVFIAIVGCISAFLVSMGLVTLPVSLPVEYRLSWLPRAKGVFLSTGNLAQYLSFAFAWVIIAPGIADKKQKFIQMARWVFFISLTMGLLATQSRNILLVLIISFFVLWWLIKNRSISSNTMVVILVSFGVLVFIPLIAGISFYFSELTDIVASAGGKYAESSINSRFVQYSVALDIIASHPFFGADVEIYKQVGPIILRIHNMWLQLLANGGIVTTLMMAFLIMRLISGVRIAAHVKEKSDEAIVVVVYIAAMFVAVMFYIGADKMFWALLGIASALTCIGTELKPDKVNQEQPNVLLKKTTGSDILRSRSLSDLG